VVEGLLTWLQLSLLCVHIDEVGVRLCVTRKPLKVRFTLFGLIRLLVNVLLLQVMLKAVSSFDLPFSFGIFNF
jgi:hypothetical protein